VKLLVPALGTRLRLAAPWTFTLHRESRNESLFPLVGWGRENAYNYGGNPSHRSVEGNRPQWAGRTESWAIERASPIAKRSFDFGEAVVPGSERATYKVLAPNHARVKAPVPQRHGSGTVCGACGVNSHSCPEVEHEVACEVDGHSVRVTGHVPPEAVHLGASAVLKGGQSALVTLPEGTVLTVDRYYIRSGANDFDSITFRLPKPAGKRKKGDPVPPSGRFWVKLRDANTIEFEYLREDQPWWFQVADRLRAGETLQVEHDVPKVPKVLTVEPLTLRTVADLPTERWLVYQEGQRVAFWLVGPDPSYQTRLQCVHGEAFGTGSQLRSDFLPVGKVVGKVTRIA
jgi:hypothetical protein